MWQVSWAVGFDAPWLGHGLGAFSEAFTLNLWLSGWPVKT